VRLKKLLPLLLLGQLSFSNLFAQTLIEGRIIEKISGKPVADVIVTIDNRKSTVSYAYGFADKDGKYKLTTQVKEDSLSIVFTLLGYESKTIALPNKSRILNVELESKDFQLKEVRVKPPDIYLREDTLNFRVDAFAREQDQNIGDVLRRLPGISVTSSGTIKYNGENINNYYIEGLNLLGNKYSIANNNISPNDIDNIQIIENHQPVKTLKDVIFSQQAAINLQLKEEKIAKPTGKMELGAGFYPWLWNLNTFAMQIGKEKQTIVTYKTNNAGKDIAADLNPHSFNMENLSSGNAMVPNDLITPGYLNSPPTKAERYLFNKTHVVSINHLRKTSEDAQLRLNINYLNNEQKQKLTKESRYYFALSDTSFVINEFNVLDRYTNQGDAELTYTHNSKKHYINNALKLSGVWNSTSSSLTGSKELSQTFYTPLFYVQNDWEMIKRIQSRIFQFSSFIRYSNLPQQLEIKTDTITGEIIQNARLGNFYTNNSTTYGFLWRRSSLRFEFNMQAFLDNLNSSVENSPLFIETDNHIRSNKWIYKITPKYSYKRQKLNFDLSVPLSINELFANNLISKTKQNFTLLFANPAVSLNYKWNFFLNSNLSYNYSNNMGDVMDFAEAYSMTNYRSFHRGSGILSRQTSQTYSVKTNYRNQIEALFFNLGIIYRRTESNLLSKMEFMDIYSLSGFIESNRRREFWIVNGNISKYVRSLKTTFSVNTSYSRIVSQQIQQGSELSSENRMITVRPKIDFKISDELNFIYNVDFITNKMRIKSSGIENPDLNQIYHFLTVNAFPSKQWTIKTRLEYYQSQLSADLSSHLFFADLSLVYKTKKVEYSLDWTNIFDQRSYAYIQYDGPNIFSSNFDLRPMNFLLNVAFKF
jgi:hypothetical protein